MNKEIWKDIPGYEGKYQASSLGRIKSIPRIFKFKSKISNQFMKDPVIRERTRTVVGKIKKLTKGNHGYYVVNLGFRDVHTVHALIAKTFIEKIYGKNHIDHINSIRLDNRVENLQWVTQRENNAKQKYLVGEERSSIFKNKDIHFIRDEYNYNDCCPKIIKNMARAYGVNAGTIRSIVMRNSWKHID